MNRDERLRAEGAMNALDVAGPRIIALEMALEGLLHRHCDGSDERYWAEWDTANEALAKEKQ